jgi:4-amino-4-deoxy-L-arabinose transferase-like glycosyltransferase
MPRLLTARDAVVWSACFVAIAAWLVLTDFTSDDPDSALHAALSQRTSERPLRFWIAPEWWGEWHVTGLYREHPAGILLLPAMLGRLGIPPVQASYIVGIAAGLGSLLLLALLITRVTSADHGRVAFVLLQLMPIAFVFRIRANHEYPMLLCLLATLIGIDAVRRSWRWVWLVAAALTAAMLIKGVFVVLIFLGAGLWILLNPTRTTGSIVRPLVAIAIGLALMAVTALVYDALYRSATGEAFWIPYWQRQLSPVTISTPLDGGRTFVEHVAFYVARLIWHPLPWSLALLALAWRVGRRRSGGAGAMASSSAIRGLWFVLGFAVLSVGMLSPSSRIAERYAFSAIHGVAAASVVAATVAWPRVTRLVLRLDAAIPAFPALVWLALMVLRLTVGAFLPRLSIHQFL